jgi:hypothetical protein
MAGSTSNSLQCRCCHLRIPYLSRQSHAASQAVTPIIERHSERCGPLQVYTRPFETACHSNQNSGGVPSSLSKRRGLVSGNHTQALQHQPQRGLYGAWNWPLRQKLQSIRGELTSGSRKCTRGAEWPMKQCKSIDAS